MFPSSIAFSARIFSVFLMTWWARSKVSSAPATLSARSGATGKNIVVHPNDQLLELIQGLCQNLGVKVEDLANRETTICIHALFPLKKMCPEELRTRLNNPLATAAGLYG
jgi:hypothetical protein